MIRTILHYPDPRLRQKGLPIERVTPELERLIDDMAETMYAAPGVGLAATQIGEQHRLFRSGSTWRFASPTWTSATTRCRAR